MKSLLSLICALAFVAPGMAGVVVYKEGERIMVFGNSRQGAARLQSFIVYDVVEQRPVAGIGFFSAGTGKYYVASTNTTGSFFTQKIEGPTGSQTVFGRTSTTNDNGKVSHSSYFARGRDMTLDLGNGETVELPRTLKAMTRAIDHSNGFPAVYESSSTLQFQERDTHQANTGAETPLQTIERIRARLEAQGYTPALN